MNMPILESFELADSTEVFVQASSANKFVVSFDGKNSQFAIWMSAEEAKQLSTNLNKALKQTKEKIWQ